MFQRQLSKEGLQSVVSKTGKATANLMSADELRELFSLRPESLSDTYDMCCGRSSAAAKVDEDGRPLPILKDQVCVLVKGSDLGVDRLTIYMLKEQVEVLRPP